MRKCVKTAEYTDQQIIGEGYTDLYFQIVCETGGFYQTYSKHEYP